jgi:Family of unknown function (DUF5709)
MAQDGTEDGLENPDEFSEDDGVLDIGDSLLSDDLNADLLDTGVDAGDGYRGATRFGTTAEEASRGESLSQLLDEEEPDTPVELPWTDEDIPSTDDEVQQPRTGRLVDSGEGSLEDLETDEIAFDVGIDGGGASAEEAALHLTDPPPFN